MSDNYENEEVLTTSSKKNTKKIIGADIGTGNLVSSTMKGNKVEISSMRDMFTIVDEDSINAAEMSDSGLDYVTIYDEDKKEIEYHAILGEDALIFSNMFNKEVRRPMAKGVISNVEIDALDILSKMLEKLSGKCKGDGLAVFSIPADAIDAEIPPVSYHENVFSSIFKNLGYTDVRSINEAHAIVFNDCAKEKFSGIAISFGAGLSNCCISYKGTNVLSFSVARAGDWIDESAGKSLNKLPNKITTIKEKNVNLLNPLGGSAKQRREIQAICFYYENLIEYVIKHFVEKVIEDADNVDIEDSIPIVLSGGTACIPGFKEVFERIFNKYRSKFPFEISEIREASDKLNAVSTGALIYAHWIDKKENKDK